MSVTLCIVDLRFSNMSSHHELADPAPLHSGGPRLFITGEAIVDPQGLPTFLLATRVELPLVPSRVACEAMVDYLFDSLDTQKAIVDSYRLQEGPLRD